MLDLFSHGPTLGPASAGSPGELRAGSPTRAPRGVPAPRRHAAVEQVGHQPGERVVRGRPRGTGRPRTTPARPPPPARRRTPAPRPAPRTRSSGQRRTASLQSSTWRGRPPRVIPAQAASRTRGSRSPASSRASVGVGRAAPRPRGRARSPGPPGSRRSRRSPSGGRAARERHRAATPRRRRSRVARSEVARATPCGDPAVEDRLGGERVRRDVVGHPAGTPRRRPSSGEPAAVVGPQHVDDLDARLARSARQRPRHASAATASSV